MGRLHCYFKPFANDQGTAYASTWTEVTNDVEQYGDLTQALDNTDYQVGIFRSHNLQLVLRNESGKYSDVEELYSIFRYSRARSKFKVTWEPGNYPLQPGFFKGSDPSSGDYIVSEEITLLEGLLEDVNSKKQLTALNVALQGLGYESVLQKIDIPTDGYARDLFALPQLGKATAADFFVVYDAAGKAWAAWLDTTGSASAPTSAVYTAIPAAQKTRVNISATITPTAIASAVLTALNALTGFTAAITGAVNNAYGLNQVTGAANLYFKRTAIGVVTASVVSDAAGGGNGSITNTVLNAGSTVAGAAVQISPGDTVLTAILNTLNQAPFNTYVTVSAGNITAAAGLSGIAVDDATKFTVNMTALDAVNKLLMSIDAVLYIKNNVCYVGPRVVNAGTSLLFYGAGSLAGNESIMDIANFSSGIVKLFDYWTWDPQVSSLTAQNASSIAKFGKLVKALTIPFVTNSTSITAILAAFLAEYGVKKREFEIITHFTPQTLALFLLDPVSVDMPGALTNPVNQNVAYYGRGVYGTDYYADTLNTLLIVSTDTFKIMSRKLSLKDQTLTLTVREV